MINIFIKILPVIAFFAVSSAAQATASRPVNDKTKAIDELRPLVAARKNNRPLLINFWATWCGPCRVEFPDLVAIDAEYRAKGLDFVIVSLDNFGAKDTIVADFLRSYESTMPSYLLDLSSRARIYRAIRRIAPAAAPGVPLTLLFDERGRLVYQRKGVVNPLSLKIQLDKVLAAEAARKVENKPAEHIK